MSNKLDGLIFDKNLNRYVPEFPETEEEEKFVITVPTGKVTMADLPNSPKATMKAALAAGWTVNAWLTVGMVPPTLYLHDSDPDINENADEEEGAKPKAEPHSAGDIKFDGYAKTIYVVEARCGNLPLGFQAHYVGKDYGQVEDGEGGVKPDKRNKAGGFECALLADPVGIVQPLHFNYQAITVRRGRDEKGRIAETEASFEKNKKRSQDMADYLNLTANDGAFILVKRPVLTASNQFTNWLSEWASYGRLTNV